MPPEQSLTVAPVSAPPVSLSAVHKAAAIDRTKPRKVTGKLKRALDLMVFGKPDIPRALSWQEAAREVSYRPSSMLKALDRDYVRRYLKQAKQVFRESASAQNISRAVELRDQDDNKTAAIQAIRYLDGISEHDQAHTPGGQVVMPGVVVQVTVNAGPAPVDDIGIIEVNPAHEPVD